MKDSAGVTAIGHASYFGRDSFVHQLLAKGSNQFLRDDESMTPLDWAEQQGNLNSILFLMVHNLEQEVTALKERASAAEEVEQRPRSKLLSWKAALVVAIIAAFAWWWKN